MYICKGCHKEFSPSGYTSHLNRTQNGLCISAYHYEIQQLEHTNLADTPEHTDNVERSPIHNKEDYELAGRPISPAEENNENNCQRDGLSNDAFAPFKSQLDWEVAKWAKLRGPSSTALTEFLAIEGLGDRLGLSFKTVHELNKLIDTELPGRPQFHHQSITVSGDTVTLYSRNILDCISALYGDPEFTHQLKHRPERHYIKEGDKKMRVFHDMQTGNWWWEMQNVLEARKPGATIVPVLLSSDRTQVTSFGSKAAYPVYLTIGNLPKEIRRKPSCRGQILLAYLPASKLKHVSHQASRRRMVTNLFHFSMQHLLQPLETAGIEGVVMKDGYGTARRIHPILAVYIGDYPEQVLVTCTKTGRCPKCDIERGHLGLYPLQSQRRNMAMVKDALCLANGNPRMYESACKAAGIKPVYTPFWSHLPFVNIFQAITPDILHQLHQGVFKHILGWLKQAFGNAEIDARCQRTVPNHHIRVFSGGISGLSRVTGKEHDQVCRIILGIISDIHLPNGFNSARLLRFVRAFLDFLFLAQLPVHSTTTLHLLAEALDRFHENKSILLHLEIRENFEIPKVHACAHYISSIKLYGTTDNYNTQNTERLHIDLAKDAYRSTNNKDEYPQMTLWLERREKIQQRIMYIHQHEQRSIKLTKRPSAFGYGATFFRDAFARFIAGWHNPDLTRAQLEHESMNIIIPFTAVSVYHCLKFTNVGFSETEDSLHVYPVRRKKNGRTDDARFDAALVRIGVIGATGIHAFRVAQVRVIFSISQAARTYLKSSRPLPQYLAYVEWFTCFRQEPERNTGMFKIARSFVGTSRLSEVIPVNNIVQSIHLFPLHGPVIPRDWKSSTYCTVLELCNTFLVNPFTDRRTYLLFTKGNIIH
ncbi:hypothetical protein JOM56_007203 [Amanita muscaria]